MRHLVFVEPGKMEWQDVPDPVPASGQTRATMGHRRQRLRHGFTQQRHPVDLHGSQQRLPVGVMPVRRIVTHSSCALNIT